MLQLCNPTERLAVACRAEIWSCKKQTEDTVTQAGNVVPLG